MNNNPFSSNIFTKKWSGHFNKDKPEQRFNFIEGISFYRHSLFKLFINIGKNLTKGMFYNLKATSNEDFKNKVFLIYDVPNFFKIDHSIKDQNLGLYRIRQYPGFLIDLSTFKSVDDYMLTTFSKGSRYKLNKFKKRFELCFDIKYKVFYGAIEKEEYDCIFEDFKQLLIKRFNDKQTRNNNLDTSEWNFYHDVAFPMILDRKASLFVIYDGIKPIAITLNYFSDNILFDAITVFDIDYAKFHVGSITIIKQIEWCLANNISILDFSKGYFDYKARWGNKKYNFEYHIFYDRRSPFSSITAYFIKIFLQLKQELRDKQINEKWNEVRFRLKNRDSINDEKLNYSLTDINNETNLTSWKKISLDCKEYNTIKKLAFEFVYLNMDCFNGLETYQSIENQNLYLFVGKNKSSLLTIHNTLDKKRT